MVGKPEGTKPLGKPRLHGRIILNWMFKERDGAWTGLVRLRIRTGSGLLWTR